MLPTRYAIRASPSTAHSSEVPWVRRVGCADSGHGVRRHHYDLLRCLRSSLARSPLPECGPACALGIAWPRGFPKANAGAADYFDWRSRQQVFSDLALTRLVANFNLAGEGEPERVKGAGPPLACSPHLAWRP